MQEFELVRELKVDADTAWARVGDFGHLMPVLPQGSAVDLDGEGVGMTRSVTIKPAPLPTVEEVTAIGHHSYAYKITRSLLPVKDFSCTFGVEPSGDGTKLVWRGTFDVPFGVPGAMVKQYVMAAYWPAMLKFEQWANGELAGT